MKTYSESDMGSMKGYNPQLGLSKSQYANLRAGKARPVKQVKKKPAKYIKKVSKAATKVLGK